MRPTYTVTVAMKMLLTCLFTTVAYSHPFMFSGLLKEPHPKFFSLVSACFNPFPFILRVLTSHPHTPTLSETINLLIRDTL